MVNISHWLFVLCPLSFVIRHLYVSASPAPRRSMLRLYMASPASPFPIPYSLFPDN
ncbi:hypothetical protein [Coleofasciculus sp. F4-SAH-05]|uniref:hypothetical protein n=1 Tax=Coleofasciculus sp. F4-SAH-05 TaxID=3069525 RepID=UPI00330286BB